MRAPRWFRDVLAQLRSWRYRRASRKHPGLRGQLMYEWSRATGEPLPEEERLRIRDVRQRSGR
jgi:hypothetical protein